MTVSSGGNGVPSGEVTPEEAGTIRRSATGKEQAPGTRTQASLFPNWREAANRLGSPFEISKIPISKLNDMRRDPMLGFGLSFIKTPHVRAKWFIDARSTNGPSAQIAAHLDHDLRKIYPSFVLQYCNSLDYGFQVIAKRYELKIPSAVYIETNPDTGEETEQPVWSEGSIEPIAWKPFVALQPEFVEPIWKGEEFNGVNFLAGADATGQGGKETKIDVFHSLWVTNERDQNFNSIWGYPRLGYAYRYWWSYWFRWAIADRAFERKADPSVKVYYPEGEFLNELTGEKMDYGEYALLIGERMRSGGVIALPSETYEDANGRGTVRQWDVDFTKDAVNFEPFDKSFDYLDVQKLRSLWIPEQAFLEGKGGTSSRNVAAEMGESFVESQAVMAAQIADHINRWVIPQWLAVNYPEFVTNESGSAKIVIQGFADQDVEFTKQLIQLIGQNEGGVQEILKMVDLKRVLQDAGTPIADFATQQRRQGEIERAAAAAAPPDVAGVPGLQVGVAPGPTGFQAYYNPPDRLVLQLSDSRREFLGKLPPTPHYEDKSVRSFAGQLFDIWRDVYQDEYETAARIIENEGEVIEEGEPVELAMDDLVNRATHMLRQWSKSEKWVDALDKTKGLMTKVANRAAKVELRRVRAQGNLDEDERERWIAEHLADFAAKVAETTRSEIRDFIAKEMEAAPGVSQEELAKRVREHFGGFPDWKADRLARTETAEVYRAATLLAAKGAGLDRVQAVDAQYGDTDDDCEERDGQIFTVDDAWTLREHPNGTLAFRMVPANLSIEYDEIDGATFEPEQMQVTLSADIDPETERVVLRQVLDHVLT